MTRRVPTRPSGSSGAALIIVLFLLIMLTALGLLISDVTEIEVRLESSDLRWEMATQAAESGIEEALSRLRAGMEDPSDPKGIVDRNVWDGDASFIDVEDPQWRVTIRRDGTGDFEPLGETPHRLDYDVTLTYVRPYVQGGGQHFYEYFDGVDNEGSCEGCEDGIVDNEVAGAVDAGGTGAETSAWVMLYEGDRPVFPPEYGPVDQALTGATAHTASHELAAAPVVQITSVGWVPLEGGPSNLRRRLVARVVNDVGQYDEMALCSCGDLLLPPGVTTYSVDPTQPEVQGTAGAVYANGDLSLGGNQILMGDVLAWGRPEGTCGAETSLCGGGGGGTVVGQARTRYAARVANWSFEGGLADDLPFLPQPCPCGQARLVRPPEGLAQPANNDNERLCVDNPWLGCQAGDEDVPAGALLVPNGQTLRMTPGTYVLQSFEVRGGGIVEFHTNGSTPIRMIVEGCLETDAGALLRYIDRASGLPWEATLGEPLPAWLSGGVRLEVFGACPEPAVKLGAANGGIYVDLYSPEHEVLLSAAGTIYGRLLGGRIHFGVATAVVFDEGLRGDAYVQPGDRFRIVDRQALN